MITCLAIIARDNSPFYLKVPLLLASRAIVPANARLSAVLLIF